MLNNIYIHLSLITLLLALLVVGGLSTAGRMDDAGLRGKLVNSGFIQSKPQSDKIILAQSPS